MKIKAALRQKSSQGYWVVATDASDVAIRTRFMGRANKPSGKRKAIAALAAKHPRVNPLIKYQDPDLLGIKANH